MGQNEDQRQKKVGQKEIKYQKCFTKRENGKWVTLGLAR